MRTSKSESTATPGRGVFIAVGTAAAAVVVAAAGVALFFSARTDDVARSNLGVGLLTGLLTGLVVGVSIFALEYVVERRREAEEQRNRNAERDYLLDYAGRSLARLVVESAQVLWVCLVKTDARIDLGALPGYEPTTDRNKVTTGVHWVADLDETGGDWFDDPAAVEIADALVQAGVHQAALEGLELSESDFERLRFLADEAASRVVGTSTYLSRNRESRTGQRVADVASNLRGGVRTGRISDFVDVELPRVRPAWSTDGDIDVLHVGPEMAPLVAFTGELVGYVADVLRRGLLDPGDSVERRPGIPAAPGELPKGQDLVATNRAEFDTVHDRWPSLVWADAGPEPWANRFAPDSWFRALLARTAASVSANYGVRSLESEPGTKGDPG